MKKNLLFFILFVFSSTLLFGQKTNLHKSLFEKKNELKIDAVKLLTFPSLEIEYERIYNDWMSLGGIMSIGNGGNIGFPRFNTEAFWRGYFTKAEAYGSKGFFGQAFLTYRVSDYEHWENNHTLMSRYSGAGVGFAIGYKWTNKAGFVIQLDWGLSRILVANTDYFDELQPKFGIKTGWRF